MKHMWDESAAIDCAYQPIVTDAWEVPTFTVCVKGFVSHTKLGVYTMKQMWEESAARQDILDAFLSDQRVDMS